MVDPLPEFYEAARKAGLSDDRADRLLEEIRAAGRAGRTRKITPLGVDRRIVRKVLEAVQAIAEAESAPALAVSQGAS